MSQWHFKCVTSLTYSYKIPFVMSTNHSSEQNEVTDKKNIVVSVILTESTASLLELNLPHLEEMTSESNESSICAVIRNNVCVKEISPKTSSYSESFNAKQMSSETFYFTSIEEFQESDASIDERNGIFIIGGVAISSASIISASPTAKAWFENLV